MTAGATVWENPGSVRVRLARPSVITPAKPGAGQSQIVILTKDQRTTEIVFASGGWPHYMVSSVMDIRKFLHEYVEEVEPIEGEAALAYWEAATTGNEEAEARATEYEARLMRIHADKKAHRRLSGVGEITAGGANVGPRTLRDLSGIRSRTAGRRNDRRNNATRAGGTEPLQQLPRDLPRAASVR